MKKFFLILTLGLAACMGLTSYPAAAYAATETDATSLDGTSVEEDLQGVIDPAKYPADPEGEVRLVQEMGLAEYCYSLNEELAADYGVYFYVYNPAQLPIRTSDVSNVVNMATSFADDGEAMGYQNIALTFLDASDDGLFYKFKIQPARTVLKMEQSLAAKNGGKRIYNIAGIQLWEAGAKNPTDYHVDTIFTCTGFARGCGSDPAEESTLDIRMSGLTTLDLKVEHTFYRTNSSAAGSGHQNQLNTVFFTIPSRYFTEGAKLQQIKAEWWEYKTKPILVTSNKDLYNAVNPFVGKLLKDLVPGAQYNKKYQAEGCPYAVGGSFVRGHDIHNTYGPSWNCYAMNIYETNPLKCLYYLFPTKNWGPITNYDPAADIEESGGISSSRLEKYILDFDENYTISDSDDGYLSLRDNRQIRAALFEDSIDASRYIQSERGKIGRGYSFFNFDANLDVSIMKSWQGGNPSFWDNWANYGLLNTMLGNIPNDSNRIVAPIYIIKESDFIGSDKDIAERLMVQLTDVEALRERYAKVKGKEELILFRFATTDYYSEEATIIKIPTSGLSITEYVTGEAYFAQETVFFDFDIIQIGMLDSNREIHIIPVVQSPIDIISPITSPTTMTPNNRWILWCIIAGAIVIVLMIADGILENKAGGTIL